MTKNLQFAAVFDPSLCCICYDINIALGDNFGQKGAWSLVKLFKEVFGVIVDFEELHWAQKAGAKDGIIPVENEDLNKGNGYNADVFFWGYWFIHFIARRC